MGFRIFLDMERFKLLPKSRITQIPKSPGIYAFFRRKSTILKGGEFLYIGKANNLRERVKSYFYLIKSTANSSSLKTKSLNQAEKIGFIKTKSPIEALILEAELIKKYKPKYNVIWRDSKNYFFVAITKELLPRIFITHQPKPNYQLVGPFVDGKSLKVALKYLRRVFPYYTTKHPKNLCPWCHLKLCPGPPPHSKIEQRSFVKEYQKNIRNLIEVLKGGKQKILKGLKKEMIEASQKQNFEKAAEIRDKISAFNSIFEHAQFIEEKLSGVKENWKKTAKELKNLLKTVKKIEKIEAYDISNIQGKEATGSMVTFINGKADKNYYRRFRIKTISRPNDVAMIKEVLSRRFEHKEWPFPDLILIDGGMGQLSTALRLKIQNEKIRNIKFMSLAKGKNELYIEGLKKPIRVDLLPNSLKSLFLNLINEAHRFARAYHHKLRKKEMLSQ